MPATAAWRHAGPMHISDWPAPERPREKLLGRGAGALSDAELLALARERGWLAIEANRVRPTAQGRRFANDVIALFL